MEALICTYQLWMGLRQSILSDTRSCVWVPNHWLMHLQEIMHKQNIQIKYQAWTIPVIQPHNRFLMEDFLDLNFTRIKLEQLNVCCMYLQVMTPAEIMDHSSNTLLPQILSSPKDPVPAGLMGISKSMLHWPNIAMPSPACWQLWSQTVCEVYTGSSTSQNLTQPLGPWLATHNNAQFWHWHMPDATHLPYKNSIDDTGQVALPMQQCHTMMKFSPTVPTSLAFHGPPITPLDPLSQAPMVCNSVQSGTIEERVPTTLLTL